MTDSHDSDIDWISSLNRDDLHSFMAYLAGYDPRKFTEIKKIFIEQSEHFLSRT